MTLSRLTHNQAAYRLPEPLILEGLATGNGERLPRQGCVPRLLTTFFFIFLLFPGAAVALGMHFVPAEPAHQGAVIEYAEIWRKHGKRIVAALEEGTGIALPEQEIEVRVWEAISKSGRRGEPMYLRASYPQPTKKATLVHELGHRYLLALNAPNQYEDIHYPLSLLLHRVWTELWGLDFAEGQIEVEKARSDRYRRAWKWVCSLSDEKRNLKWEAYIAAAARSSNKALNATAESSPHSGPAAGARDRRTL